MGTTRRYEGSPGLASLYARTVRATMRRGPAEPGTGPITLELPQVGIDPSALAGYREVTGFPARPVLPVTYPHVLAFPLRLDLMSDPTFPYRPMGLVHLSDVIAQYRPIPVEAEPEVAVFAEPARPHSRGEVFEVISRVALAGEVVWLERTVLLSRGPGRSGAPVDLLPDPAVGPSAEWHLRANLGRRYAAVSGDRNPIHLYRLSAQAFGFRRQIAHGMWATAACLASLGPQPDALEVRVDFRKPLYLPGRARFGFRPEPDGSTGFALYGDAGPHLIGRLTPG